MTLSQRVEERLASTTLIWLTTVTEDLVPQPSLVWFWWDGNTFLIYSQPGMPKLANIEVHPEVALNLDAMARGEEEVTVINGTATVDEGTPPVLDHPEYREKYRGLIEDDLGMTVERFSEAYSVPIRITPGRVRAW